MKWTSLALICLLSIGNISFAAGKSKLSNEDQEFLSLDNEIEEMLEEEAFDEGMEMAYEPLPLPEKKASPLPLKNKIQQMPVIEKKTLSESIPIAMDQAVAEEEKMVTVQNPLDRIKEETAKSITTIEINLRQIFQGAPLIYTILFFLSTVSVCIWLYSMLTIRSMEFLPPRLIKELRTKLISNQYDEAIDICVNEKHFFCKMLAAGILVRKYGLTVMVDTMKTEGKRRTIAFWQRIGILNDIAIIAPMLGLLGTVMGMFYAFYDLNRSIESVSLLFDGLGISVGTTVAGLVVSILAMILHSVAKYRLVRILANVENEAQTFAAMIDVRNPSYLEK